MTGRSTGVGPSPAGAGGAIPAAWSLARPSALMSSVVHAGAITNSTSATYHGDQWVTVEYVVRGHETIEHLIDGVNVLSYTRPQLDPADPDAQRLLETQPLELSGGTISLQSESHGIEFRRVFCGQHGPALLGGERFECFQAV